MDSFLSSSPTVTNKSFTGSPEMDFSSLFEQCGIPLADLDAQIGGISKSLPTTDDTTTTWYNGTAPEAGDVVEFDNEVRESSSKLSADSCAKLVADGQIDGLGNTTVSTSNRQGSSTVSPDDTHEQEADARRISSAWAAPNHHGVRSPSAADRKASTPTKPEGFPDRFSTPSPSVTSIKRRKSAAVASNMDFYRQQQFYGGAHLSSPISMNSSPENESYLYTSDFSPEFNTSGAGDLMLSGMNIEPEAMRRSQSTPYFRQRAPPMSNSVSESTFDLSAFPDLRNYDHLDVVPASDNGARNGDYLLPQQALMGNTLSTMAMTAPRPTMKRKHRPIPIATSIPRLSGLGGPQTAPLERNMPHRSIERPQLSAKRSFEDFSELDCNALPVQDYREVTTPTKRVRSSQGFKQNTVPISPYMDEPLFSPVFDVNSGLALSMHPDQYMLSSPPYSQTDFCSSPSYAMPANATNMNSYLMPDSMQNTAMYSHQEPISPVDLDSVWAQKQMYGRPSPIQTMSAYSTPRSLTYGAPSPIRKTMNRSRKPAVARAISFCNYTAADKKTILSGVAPSGSNKKAVVKAQDMSRCLSSGALSVH